MAFRVGQKVVCVDASPACDGCPVGLCANGIYTISDFCEYPHGDTPHRGIRVAEAVPPIRDGFACGCYNQMRFRPVVERATDISIFTAMLNPSKQTVDAP